MLKIACVHMLAIEKSERRIAIETPEHRAIRSSKDSKKKTTMP